MIIFKALREMVQSWDPNIVFLMETKLKMSAMKRENEKAGFVFGLIVPKAQNCVGFSNTLEERYQVRNHRICVELH